MARARNIKPSTVRNEDLAELRGLYRVGFIYSWMFADVNGVIEYRPKRLKADLFPYDDIDIEDWVLSLARKGFFALFTFEERRFIKIVNFIKHQNPHKQERDAGSDLPDLSTPEVFVYQSVDALPNYFRTTSEVLALIPDSLLLKEERGKRKEGEREDAQKPTPPEPPDASDFGAKQNVPTDKNFYHPAIKHLRELTGHDPPKASKPLLITTLGVDFDVGRLAECYARWRAKGYKATNFDFALDWYVNGIPEKNNGTGQNGQPPNRTQGSSRANNPETLRRIRSGIKT